MIYDHIADDVRARVDVAVVATRYGLQFNRSGFARCPFHDEKTASFKIQNRFYAHCFGCGVNADTISLTMQLLALDFKGAIARLNDDFLLGLPIGEKPNLRKQREMQQRRAELDALHREREAKKAEIRQIEYRIETLEILWEILDTWRRELRPTSPDEPFDERYVYAAQDLVRVDYEIDRLRTEVTRLGRQNE